LAWPFFGQPLYVTCSNLPTPFLQNVHCGWLGGWLVGWLVGWSVGWLNDAAN